jgi:histidine triad (HIT) family protein
MNEHTDCLFCKIISKSVPADIVAENEHVLAFRDINPMASTHILIVPKLHVKNVSELNAEHAVFINAMLLMAKELAQKFPKQEGYRLVINNGEKAGQSVFHLHMHLLFGRSFSWPPG